MVSPQTTNDTSYSRNICWKSLNISERKRMIDVGEDDR